MNASKSFVANPAWGPSSGRLPWDIVRPCAVAAVDRSRKATAVRHNRRVRSLTLRSPLCKGGTARLVQVQAHAARVANSLVKAAGKTQGRRAPDTCPPPLPSQIERLLDPERDPPLVGTIIVRRAELQRRRVERIHHEPVTTGEAHDRVARKVAVAVVDHPDAAPANAGGVRMPHVQERERGG